jgi:hypothetical protein
MSKSPSSEPIQSGAGGDKNFKGKITGTELVHKGIETFQREKEHPSEITTSKGYFNGRSPSSEGYSIECHRHQPFNRSRRHKHFRTSRRHYFKGRGHS